MKRYQQQSDRDRQFTRRTLLLGAGQGLMLSALVGRMYYLQVVEADQYRVLAEENRISMRLLPPLRGSIVDRTGFELAGNRLDYRVILVPEQIPDFDHTIAELRGLLKLGDTDIARIAEQMGTQRSFLPITAADNLTWEEFAGINLRLTDLPGVHPDAGETRAYYKGDAFAHIVGYVSPVSQRDLQDGEGDPLLEVPGFKIGRAGIERSFDAQLRGKAGNSRTEVNAYGRTIRELQHQDGQRGAEIKLTIDADLQLYAVNRMQAASGGITVMDIHSGDLLAMASTPGFDPSSFNVGISQKEWSALLNNIRNPLVNKVTAGQYPPGSTFKAVVGMAALESGIITPDETFFCNGSLTVGNHQFHCWKAPGHGHLDMMHAIEQSCDVFFYEVARRIGIDRIAAMAHRFGLGEVHDIGLPGVKPGLIPTEAWKRATFGEAWQGGDSVNAGIGQGYILTTPLQLAVMAARVANGGYAVKPRLVLDDGQPAGAGAAPAPVQPAPAIGIDPEHVRLVQNGMAAVCNSVHGTGYASRIKGLPYTMAGKSGSAQVRHISKAERLSGVIKNEDLEWAERDHALFIAFAPVEAPRFAVSVIVEHGGSGSHDAAPIARDMLIETIKRHMPDELASLERNPKT